MSEPTFSARFEFAIGAAKRADGVVKDMLPPGVVSDERAQVDIRRAKDYLANALECLERAARTTLAESAR